METIPKNRSTFLIQQHINFNVTAEKGESFESCSSCSRRPRPRRRAPHRDPVVSGRARARPGTHQGIEHLASIVGRGAVCHRAPAALPYHEEGKEHAGERQEHVESLRLGVLSKYEGSTHVQDGFRHCAAAICSGVCERQSYVLSQSSARVRWSSNLCTKVTKVTDVLSCEEPETQVSSSGTSDDEKNENRCFIETP